MKYNGLNECQTTRLWEKGASARRVMAKNPLLCVAVRSLNPLGHTLSALPKEFLADNRPVQ